MPENTVASRGNGRPGGTAQIQKHLETLTTDELTEELTALWDSMDEETYDPARIDAYLAELEKRESVPSLDVEGSLAAFHEKHAQLFEEAAPVQTSAAGKPARRRWRTSLIAAVVAVAVMMGSMVTVQGFGFDLFGAIARWTVEVFHFSEAKPDNGEQPEEWTSAEDAFVHLRSAMDTYGIKEKVVPTWIPEGFESEDLDIAEQRGKLHVRAVYHGGERKFSITIRQYDAKEVMKATNFEKDGADVTLYEQAGVTHYIMNNNKILTASWMANETLLCSIAGDISQEEIQQMIDSIYKE